MRRREFTILIGGAAVWPLAARAQQDGRVRRVGVLLFRSESDPEYQAWLAALRQKLQELGWIEGRNLRLDVRFDAADLVRMRGIAQELVGLAPDVIVVSSSAGTRALQEQTQTVPIVFTHVGDPVASGVVRSIARPEGNVTGVTNLFPSIAGKWVELLKEAAPHVVRVALVFNPELPATERYLAEIEAAAAVLAIKAIRTPVRGAAEIEGAIHLFAISQNGGLIMVPPVLAGADRELVLRLAKRHRLPVVSTDRFYAAAGDLISYGPDSVDLFRSAAYYVDRILRGAKPGELPVQFPTKFELVINLKTAKAIGLDIPPTLRARADEVIE
jgi:putative ABC transport system substrate-binding protein